MHAREAFDYFSSKLPLFEIYSTNFYKSSSPFDFLASLKFNSADYLKLLSADKICSKSSSI